MKETISVIVPLYYGKSYIPHIILQLENCAYKLADYKIQLILSNDSPGQKIENTYHSSMISIKIVHAKHNGGIHKARVRGLKSSDGNYILFLDQDDRITPDYFESQLAQIGNADAVVCNAVSGGRIKYNLDRPLYKATSRQSMVEEGNMILSPGQVLLRREAIPECWIKDTMQKNGADDWLLWLCMHSEGRQFAINKEVLFIREVHCHNVSAHSGKMALSEREVVEIVEKNHLLFEDERNILRDLLPKLQEKRAKENEKWRQMFLVLNDWFQICNHGKSAACYLRKQNIKKVAIYGFGYLGETLLDNLRSENVEVAYIIDKNAAFLDLNIRCCTLEDALGPVDGVIISLIKDSLSNEIHILQDSRDEMLSNNTLPDEVRSAKELQYGMAFEYGNLGLERKIKEKLETKVVWLEDIVACMK